MTTALDETEALAASGIIRMIDQELAPEAVRRPVDSASEARSFREALLYWRSRRDRSPLRPMNRPPADAIGDEVYDVCLAVVFRDLAETQSVVEAIGLIQQIIEINRRNLAYHEEAMRRQSHPDLRQETALCLGRLYAFLFVLETWKQDILDEAGGVDDRGAR